MNLNGRVKKLEAMADLTGRVTGTISTHDRGRPDAVVVRGGGPVRRLSEEEFARRYPGALLVAATCFCAECYGEGDK